MEFVSTGVKGVDSLLREGGFPKSYIILVLGTPGSGKTIFGLQFLYNGARNGDTGVYVTFDESPSMMLNHMASLGWDTSIVQDGKKLVFIDASPIRMIPGDVGLAGVSIGKKDFALISLIDAIKKKVKEIGAKRLVIDPLTTMMVQYPGLPERRAAMLDLMQAIADTKCTSLLISEVGQATFEREYTLEEYLAHGVVVLTRILRPDGVIRIFSIEKMRGVDHDSQPHPYRITQGGIEVYAQELTI